MIEAADVIIGNVKPDRLHAPERLQWLQLNSAGADAYVKPGILRSTTMLTSATGAYGKAVAEHSFAMLLMLQKKLNLYRDARQRTNGAILVQSHPLQMSQCLLWDWEISVCILPDWPVPLAPMLLV